MGYIKHHTIVVTSFSDELIKESHEKAKSIHGELVSELVLSTSNSWTSFFVAPDGSKEGWPASDTGDSKRHEFIDYLDSLNHSDGRGSISYCELFFGEDNGYSQILSHN